MKLRKIVEKRDQLTEKTKVVMDLRAHLEGSTEYDDSIRDEVLADMDAFLLAVYSGELGQIDNVEVDYGKEEDKRSGSKAGGRSAPRRGGSARAKREGRRARGKNEGDGPGGRSSLQ